MDFSVPVIFLPVILIPLFLRFIISPLIIKNLSKKYMGTSRDSVLAGWENEQDQQAMLAIISFCQNRLKEWKSLKIRIKDDSTSIFNIIQKQYGISSDNSEISFHFSIQRLCECSIIALSDIYLDFKDSWWFKFFLSFRLRWYYIFTDLTTRINKITNLPILRHIFQTRLLTSILRILLIPIIGIPIIVLYILRVIFLSTFSEGALRFFYFSILMRTGFYMLFLFGKKNTMIKDRISHLPEKKRQFIWKKIDEMLDQLGNDQHSVVFQDALKKYQQFAEMNNIGQDNDFQALKKENKSFAAELTGFVTRVFSTVLRSYSAYFDQKKENELDLIYSLIESIGSCYYPTFGNPLLGLRLADCFAAVYIAAHYCLKWLNQIPGLSNTLENLSIDVILQSQGIVKNIAPHTRTIGLATKVQSLLKIVKSGTSPLSLVVSFGSPVAIQAIKDVLRQYAYSKAVRLLLYSFENSYKKSELNILHIVI